MLLLTLRSLAVMGLAASVIPVAAAQQYSPHCAAPQGPLCPVPPVPCEPACGAPAGCLGCAEQQSIGYQPQSVHCSPRLGGWHGLGLRPLFNYTKISVQNREECNPGQSRCGHLPEPTGAAVPVMAMQPVQLQMTAYQPVMMTQFVQSAPQMVAMPQMVQPAPQLVSMPPVHQVMYRPQQLNPQAVGDDCNLNNVCEKLAQLRDRVASLESRLAAGSEPEGYAVLEQRVTDTEKAIRLQTEILDEIRHHLKSARE